MVDKIPKDKKKEDYEDELIFESSEDLELYNSFDEMGLREELIKGKHYHTNSKVSMHMDMINQVQFKREPLFLSLEVET